MKLFYTHTNGADFVVLMGSGQQDDTVLSSWEVTPEVLRNFCDCSQDPSDWDNQGLGADIDDFGEVIAERVGFELQALDSAKWSDRVAFIGR